MMEDSFCDNFLPFYRSGCQWILSYKYASITPMLLFMAPYDICMMERMCFGTKGGRPPAAARYPSSARRRHRRHRHRGHRHRRRRHRGRRHRRRRSRRRRHGWYRRVAPPPLPAARVAPPRPATSPPRRRLRVSS